jgi:hypothetical protein
MAKNAPLRGQTMPNQRLIAALDLIGLTNVAMIWMALQRVAVSLEPTRETCLSSSIVAFSGLAMSKTRAID